MAYMARVSSVGILYFLLIDLMFLLTVNIRTKFVNITPFKTGILVLYEMDQR